MNKTLIKKYIEMYLKNYPVFQCERGDSPAVSSAFKFCTCCWRRNEIEAKKGDTNILNIFKYNEYILNSTQSSNVKREILQRLAQLLSTVRVVGGETK